jgi:hypothetical protein
MVTPPARPAPAADRATVPAADARDFLRALLLIVALVLWVTVVVDALLSTLLQ